mgnify:CR=1 FL=1
MTGGYSVEDNKVYDITAIAVYKGAVQVIEPTGNIMTYRQRNIGNMSEKNINNAIQKGLLRMDILNIPDIPSNYNLEYEETSIMGEVEEYFNYSYTD